MREFKSPEPQSKLFNFSARSSSDIDVLVLGAPRGDALAEAMQKLERQLGREINYTVLTRKEFDSRRTRKDTFLENVWQNERVSLIPSHEKTQASSEAPRKSFLRPIKSSVSTRRLVFNRPTRQC